MTGVLRFHRMAGFGAEQKHATCQRTSALRSIAVTRPPTVGWQGLPRSGHPVWRQGMPELGGTIQMRRAVAPGFSRRTIIGPFCATRYYAGTDSGVAGVRCCALPMVGSMPTARCHARQVRRCGRRHSRALREWLWYRLLRDGARREATAPSRLV